MPANRPLLLAAGAVSFLTRVPVGSRRAIDGSAVAASVPLFPLVGAGVGALGGATVALLSGPLPPAAAATIGLGLVAAITGAMHLDALADTADALGGTTRARRLEIMRDHAVGAFGATALVVAVVLVVSLVGSLDGLDAVTAWAAAAALGRGASPPLARLLPAARADGQGVALDGVGTTRAVVAVAVALAVAFAALGTHAVWPVAAAAAVSVVLAALFRRWLGGVTGDCLGATTQLAELAALAAIVAAT